MKITNLLEATIASMPEPGQVSFRSGRSETSLEEMTAGSVASVPMPMGKVIKRESGITQGIKKSVDEGAINENDLSEEQLTAKQRREEFFNKSQSREIGNKPSDREIMAKEEFNGGGEYNDEVDMVKNNLHTIVRVSVGLAKELQSNENMPEWVQEKIAVAKSMMVTVMDYMISQHERGNVYTQDVEEAQSASIRMQKALQREKEKREYSERYAEKNFPIGKKPESNQPQQKEVKEDDKAVDDFLARGGKIQHGKSQKGPKNPGLSYGSKHIGGSGDKMKMSRTGYGTKPAGNKPVVTAEGQDWMDDMRAVAHKIAPQDKMNQAHADRQSQQQAKQQEQMQQDIENLPDLISQYRDMKSEYESMGGSNWQYADNEQNLSDEERKARGMETSMRQLADRIRAAKQASEGLAESKPDFGKMFDKKIGKHNKAVVKTKKEIGTRVADIGAGGKEYNVKTDKEWDKQKGVAEESEGLWANIHAKRNRIKNGSGEKMRKPGSKGAPTADALRKSAK
jgi:hypothetical protein